MASPTLTANARPKLAIVAASLPVAVPFPPPGALALLPGAVGDGDGVVTCAGTVSLSAVKLTGGGRVSGVMLVFMLDATNTAPPPAPTALTLGAEKGT